MKKLVFLSTLLLCVAGFNQNSYADNHTELDKYIDFDALKKSYGEPKVQINLEKGLINLVAAMAKNEDPEAGEVLASVDAVSVNVFNIGDKTKSAFDSIDKVASRMQKLNWVPAVSVNQENEKVRIFVKQKGDLIEGLLVLSAGKNNEAVFINIVGNIDPTKIGKVTESLDLDLGLGAKGRAK